MPRELNVNIAKQNAAQAQDRADGGNRTPKASVIYKPLPLGKTNETKANKLYFSCFLPGAWTLHNATPQDDPQGLLNPGPVVSPELCTYYWQLMGHYLEMPVPGSSYTRTYFFLCPKSTNKTYTEKFQVNPLFRDARCRVCDAAVPWWAKFDEQWAKSTLNGQPITTGRWKTSADDFKKILQQNNPLRAYKEQASAYSVATRYLFEVLDLDKLEGKRALDEGETAVAFQFWPAAKGVFDGLNTLNTNGIKFHDLQKPCAILATKDCSKGYRNAVYSVQNLGPVEIAPANLAYMADDRSLRDLPFGLLGQDGADFFIASYDDMGVYLDRAGMGGTPEDHKPDAAVPAALLPQAAAPSTPATPAVSPRAAFSGGMTPPAAPPAALSPPAAAPFAAPPPPFAPAAPMAMAPMPIPTVAPMAPPAASPAGPPPAPPAAAPPKRRGGNGW